jgi:hypothetical protein
MPWKEENVKPVLSKEKGIAGRQEDEFTPVVLERHIPGLTPFGRLRQDGFLLFVEMEG